MSSSIPIPNPPTNQVGTSPSGITYSLGETLVSSAFSCAFASEQYPMIDEQINQCTQTHLATLEAQSDWLYFHIGLDDTELKLEWKVKDNTSTEQRNLVENIFRPIINKIIAS